MENFDDIDIKSIFDQCPICHGTGEFLNYRLSDFGEMTVEDCDYCYHGLIIKDMAYKKIAEELGIKFYE